MHRPARTSIIKLRRLITATTCVAVAFCCLLSLTAKASPYISQQFNVKRGCSAPVIANPGFETPAVPGSFTYFPSGFTWLPVGAGLMAVTGNASGWGNPNSPEGTQALILQGGETASQSLSGFNKRNHYTLSVYAAQRACCGAPYNIQFQVALDNTVLGTFTPVTGAYTFYSMSFTISSGVHLLKLSSVNPSQSDNSIFVDGLTLTATCPP